MVCKKCPWRVERSETDGVAILYSPQMWLWSVYAHESEQYMAPHSFLHNIIYFLIKFALQKEQMPNMSPQRWPWPTSAHESEQYMAPHILSHIIIHFLTFFWQIVQMSNISWKGGKGAVVPSRRWWPKSENEHEYLQYIRSHRSHLNSHFGTIFRQTEHVSAIVCWKNTTLSLYGCRCFTQQMPFDSPPHTTHRAKYHRNHPPFSVHQTTRCGRAQCQAGTRVPTGSIAFSSGHM